MPIGDITKCRSPKKRQKTAKKPAKIGFFAATGRQKKTDRDEISQVKVYRGFVTAHQIWPSSVNRGRYRGPQKVSKFAPNYGLWPPESDTMNTFR